MNLKTSPLHRSRTIINKQISRSSRTINKCNIIFYLYWLWKCKCSLCCRWRYFCIIVISSVKTSPRICKICWVWTPNRTVVKSRYLCFFRFPKSIKVENNVTFIFSSSTSGNLFANDSTTAMQGTSFQIQTISFSGTLSSISLQSSSQPVLYYFSVDGSPLIDSVTNNFGLNGFYLPFGW